MNRLTRKNKGVIKGGGYKDSQEWHPEVIKLGVVRLEPHDLNWSPFVLIVPVTKLT